MPLIIALLLACSRSPPPPGTEAAETEWIQDISADANPVVSTVVEVVFTTPGEGRAWVEFGAGGSFDRATPPDEGGVEHRHALVGMPPLSAFDVRIKAEIDGVIHESGSFTAENGQIQAGTPILEVTVADYQPADQSLLLMSVFANPNSHMLLLGWDGQAVWSVVQGDTERRSITALPSWEGGSFLYATMLYQVWREEVLTTVDLSGETGEEIPLEDGHHFFEQLPDGTIVWIAKDVRETEEYGPVVGDRLLVRRPSGEEEEIFTIWDHLDVTPTHTWGTTFYLEGQDWTHFSGISYSPARDSFLVTAAGANVLLVVSASGELEMLAGGEGLGPDAFRFAEGSPVPEMPHGAHWSQDGQDIVVFATIDGVSRVIRYRVDWEERELTAVWTFGEELDHFAPALGSAEEMADGNYLVNWGSLGMIQVVSPEGGVLWEALSAFEETPAQVWRLASPYAGRADR